LDPLVPFLCIYEAARTGEVQKVKEYSAVFSIHADKMVESAKVSAYMSDNKILKQNLLVTADDLSQTIHPVVNAALTLSGNNEEQCYIENMDVIK
jgi:catenin alpha